MSKSMYYWLCMVLGVEIMAARIVCWTVNVLWVLRRGLNTDFVLLVDGACCSSWLLVVIDAFSQLASLES